MSYLYIKWIHIAAVALSGLLFFLRGAMDLLAYNWRRWPVLRWLPHVIDTVLLSSAIVLTILLGQYPLTDHWLTAKVLGLISYVVLGVLALKSRSSLKRRGVFFLLALLNFIYIIGVARTHHPASWWVLFYS